MRPLTLSLALVALAAGPPRYFDDAALRAVVFVDRNEGWAAGDEGTVWHSIDGGATWERQPTGVRASLRGLCFLTPYTGVCVGREELPGGVSAGVVLLTTDGGLTWSRAAAGRLPGLNGVKFFDDHNGLVFGDGTDRHPSGVFATADGGRTWKPLPGPRVPTWLAADFSDPQTGALGGAWSRMSILRGGAFSGSEVDPLGGRAVADVKLQGQRAVAVGDGGLVLLSRDSAGARWGFDPMKPLPQAALFDCDFRAVAQSGDHLWVAGRPGSIVFHSPDRGKTWDVQLTGQPLPINSLCFLNDRDGCAVGEMGTVLVTRDGGKTWTATKRGGQRAAALFVHTDADGLPLDTVAALGLEDGYLTAALRVVSADPASAAPERARDSMRFAAAVRQAGGAAGETLWQFPRPGHLSGADAKGLLAALDALHDGKAAEGLLRQTVLALRLWQPELVVCDADGSPAAEAAREAFRRAEDPNAFPEQLRVLGLKPWQPKKLYALCADGPVALDPTRSSVRLGDTARDFAAGPFALLSESPLPAKRCYRLRE